jgi:hypothetical protein
MEWMAGFRNQEPGKNANVQLGIPWIFEPEINFYRKKLQYEWLSPATREGPDGRYDLYYLTAKEVGLIEKLNLEVVKEYPDTSTFVAVPR